MNNKGVLSIINSKRNKRILLSRQLAIDLELEDEVCIDVFTDMVEIYKPYDENIYAYPLRNCHTKDKNSRKVIYCADLIRKINDALDLKYKGKTTYTIRTIEYRYGGVLVLRIKKEDQL